jgi:hypothetical protein
LQYALPTQSSVIINPVSIGVEVCFDAAHLWEKLLHTDGGWWFSLVGEKNCSILDRSKAIIVGQGCDYFYNDNPVPHTELAWDVIFNKATNLSR